MVSKVVNFDEQDKGEGEFTLEGATRRRVFLCKVTDPLGAEDALFKHHTSLQPGYVHPTNRLLRVKSFRARQAFEGQNRDGLFAYTVSVDYDSRVSELESPLAQEARIRWFSEQHQTYAYKDKDGKLLVNTASDVLLVPVQESHWTITVSKKLPRVPSWLKSYADAINSGRFSIDGETFERRKLMVSAIGIGDYETVIYRDRRIKFREFSYTLKHNRNGWKVLHPNVGFNERAKVRIVKRDTHEDLILDAVGVPQYELKEIKRKILIGDPGEPPNEPQPLDKQGRHIKNATKNDIIDIEGKYYPELNFSRLPTR